jgi:hypothetical protein
MGASIKEALEMLDAHIAGFDTASAMVKVFIKKYRANAIAKIDNETNPETIQYWKGVEDSLDQLEASLNSLDKQTYSDPDEP